MRNSSQSLTVPRLAAFCEQLYPFHRSITGDGLRQTFDLISKIIPLNVHEIPTGTKVLDWEVPKEWRLRDAYIADAETGTRIVNIRDSNLHVVSYSQPVDTTLTWRELEAHVTSEPEMPDAIPYRTCYFRDEWGFCVTEHQRRQLASDSTKTYRVVIDSEFFEGALSYAESTLGPEDGARVLVYAHACHPSLANDNLSGLAVATFLAERMQDRELRHRYRFVFAPATIGAISWLAKNRSFASEVTHGLVLTLLGDSRALSYKRSVHHDSAIDRIVEHLWGHRDTGETMRDFSPIGYDERQFGSPGFQLPVGCLMRSAHGEFPEYHTSADNLDLISPEQLWEALNVCDQIVDVIEGNRFYRNLRPDGEPQLGRYGIYRAFGQADNRGQLQEAVMWVLNQSDGSHDLLSIAERSGLPFQVVQQATGLLLKHGLLATMEE